MADSDQTPPPQDLDVTVASPHSSNAPLPPTSGEHGRFLPGARFGNRYRIVGLLGRGGMGEVYRADDLELGQSVALKLLPASLSNDAAALGRLRAEVRLARQVSHPNVCRVYDLGEAEGQHFLTMEFVDGEDLALLLGRIGRLPQEKGLDLAHQLCSGLDAAHSAGILHRDLKPANIMIDGRGRARLMDFGLALTSGDAEKEPAAGTFAYMAPEQLAGKPASTASDIYALGLVLYELLSGKRAHQAESLQDLRELRPGGTISSLSAIVDLLDPVVEQTVMRCLDPDPSRRPTSARAIAAALPGGDPLAAAMAAGETPSPEVVAAAGERGGLTPLHAMLWLLIALLAIPGTLVLQSRYGLMSYLPTVLPPDELLDEAVEMMQRLGHEEPMSGSSARAMCPSRCTSRSCSPSGVAYRSSPAAWSGSSTSPSNRSRASTGPTPLSPGIGSWRAACVIPSSDGRY